MKRFVLLGSLLSVALVGCGLVSLPPIANPFGLDGKTTVVALGASAQASGTATVSAQFEDLKDLPSVFSSMNYQAAIQSVSLSGCPASPPATVAVTFSLDLTVSDGAGASARTVSASVSGAKFNLSISGTSVSVSNVVIPDLVPALASLQPILQNGGTNTAQMVATLNTVSSPDLAGCTMNITWGGGNAVLKI
jgi:hypothetical protein